MTVTAKAKCTYMEINNHTGLFSVRLVPDPESQIQGQISLQLNRGDAEFQVGRDYNVTIYKIEKEKKP